MEVKLNPKIDSMAPLQGAAARPREVAEAKDGAAFEHTAALNQAMKGEPDVRSEKVAMGIHLVGSVNYPPPEMINRIANLLAMKLGVEENS